MELSCAVNELKQARLARDGGFEGKSRVLARRAAGLAIRFWLRRSTSPLMDLSLNELIKDARVRLLVPFSIHDCLERLTTRVDLQYHLPEKFDLIADVDQILNTLSNEMEAAK